MNRPMSNAVFAPWERLLDSPLYARGVAALSAALSMIGGDILFVLLPVLLFTNVWDTIMGRVAALKRNEAIDSDRGRFGFLTKITGFVYVFVIRAIEHWGQANEILGLEHTNGAIAAALAMTLLLMELESIEGHRVQIGGRPIPALSAIIRTLRTIEARLLVATNPIPPPVPTPPSASEERDAAA